jgi:histidinol-phosphatase (PHP family)
MIHSDFHVHTSFSTDSDTPVETQIETLIEKGITEICITDHEDIGYTAMEEETDTNAAGSGSANANSAEQNETSQPESRPFRIDPFTYYETLLRLIPKYAHRAHISIGVELGLRTDYHHSIEDFAEVCPWDFIIGSTHVVKGIDPYYPQYWAGKTKKQGILEYYEDTLANIRQFDCFDVYGHIDYIVRYAPGQRDNYSILDYKDIIDEILKLLIEKGKGIECNTAGFKYGLDNPNPEAYVLKRYHELGGEILTIGSDGHKPEYTAYDFDKVPALLEACGIRYYTVFHERKPIMLPV